MIGTNGVWESGKFEQAAQLDDDDDDEDIHDILTLNTTEGNTR